MRAGKVSALRSKQAEHSRTQAAVNELDAAMSPAKPDPQTLERAIRKAERFGPPRLSKAKDLLIDWQDAAAVSVCSNPYKTGEQVPSSKSPCPLTPPP